jgi:predicted Zn-dependent protease
LLSPAAVAAILSPMSPWFSAEEVQAGRSPLTDRRELPVFSKFIDLIDDGRHPLSPEASPFDLEGSATQETKLVAAGVLRDYLYDTYAATRENRLSTGNFLRAQDAAGPAIGASVLYVKPSAVRAATLRRAVSQGLFLQTITEVTAADRSPTSLQLRGNGWRVESGRCVEPLRDVVLTVDAIDLFARAVGVGDDLAFFNRFGAPSILFEDVPLSDQP